MSEVLTLKSLPLFPLGTVLFPGGLLPLRIFEVRYLDMIARCHKAGAPFGIVSLTRGHEVRQPGATESFSSIGTLALIETIEYPQPGLMLIRCHGEQRFRIDNSERMKNGLWLGDVQRIDSDMPVAVPPDLQAIADSLAQVIRTLRERQTEDAPFPMREPLDLADCGWVANRWCELLPLQTELKQRLMELDNPLVRLELVGDILARTGITPDAN